MKGYNGPPEWEWLCWLAIAVDLRDKCWDWDI